MKQSYIDFIEKAVREHCKELQKLSMGCRLKYGALSVIINYSRPTLDGPIYKYMTDGGQVFYDSDDRMKNGCLSRRGDNGEVEWWEILGHPIHLEHILRTMGEDWGIDGSGGCLKLRIDHDLQEAGYYYEGETFNLSLSWKDQTEETLKFLAETLGFSKQ